MGAVKGHSRGVMSALFGVTSSSSRHENVIRASLEARLAFALSQEGFERNESPVRILEKAQDRARARIQSKQNYAWEIKSLPLDYRARGWPAQRFPA